MFFYYFNINVKFLNKNISADNSDSTMKSTTDSSYSTSLVIPSSDRNARISSGVQQRINTFCERLLQLPVHHNTRYVHRSFHEVLYPGVIFQIISLGTVHKMFQHPTAGVGIFRNNVGMQDEIPASIHWMKHRKVLPDE